MRVSVVQDAMNAHATLKSIALFIVILGLISAVFQAISLAPLGISAILIALVTTAMATVTLWGLLTAAAVVVGYVANRS